MTKINRLLAKFCQVVLVFLVFFGTSAAQADEIRLQTPSDFGQLDPAFWQSNADQTIIDAIFPKLIEFKSGKNWEYELSAAESIEQVDPLTIKFTLKKGLMWTGGYGEVTAEDVEYSFERFIDKDLAAPNQGDWAPLKDVEVVDKYSGIIHFNEPFAPVWWSTLPYTGGAIINKASTEAVGGKFTTEPGATAGPYKIKKWEQGQQTVLVAHDGWNVGKKPKYDRVILIPISDSKSAEVAFEAGQIDVSTVSISSIQEIKANMPADSVLEVRPTARYTWLGLNGDNPALQDLRVRQAITKAIDVDAIIEGAYFGIPDRSTGLIAPGLIGFSEEPQPARDVVGARALLAEAGIDSLNVELELQNSKDEQTAGLIIQANLAEIGINVQLNTHDGGTFWSLGDEKGTNLQMTLKEYASPPDPAWSTQWFLPGQAGIWNWEWFNSEEYEKLHYDAISEIDFDKRAKIYHEMQDIMDASHSFVWLIHPPKSVIYKNSINPGLLPNGDYNLKAFSPAK